MSSFFTTPASQRKRKRQETSTAPSASRKRNTTQVRKSTAQLAGSRSTDRTKGDDADDSISGSDSGEDAATRDAIAYEEDASDTSSDDVHNTAAERRLKLAERYLDNIRAEVGNDDDERIGFDAADIDRQLIAARLKEDVAEGKGRVYRFIANELDFPHASRSFFRTDTLATLAVAVCIPYVYTASKDIRLMKWQLVQPRHAAKSNTAARRLKPRLLKFTRGNKNRDRDMSFQHHTASILCIAASADGKFVATGGADRRLIIWDPSTLKPLKIFTHHRDSVTALAFRGKTNQLFSASKDRTVKIWSLDELAYVETLFGHQDEVVDVAAVAGTQERCVSVGARDRTARLWKVVEESQLVFRGGGSASSGSSSSTRHHATSNGFSLAFAEGSIDRVSQIDSQLFVTGSDSGALSLFSLHKKKPLHVYPLAHGYDPPPLPSRSSAELEPSMTHIGAQPTPRWITALKSIPFSDLFVTGSWDGVVKIWRIAGKDEAADTEADPESRGKGLCKIEPVASLGLNDHKPSENSLNEDVDLNNGRIRGFVNDLAVVERGDRGKDGVCVVAAVGTEPRLGRWMKVKGKNGSVVFEIPRRVLQI